MSANPVENFNYTFSINLNPQTPKVSKKYEKEERNFIEEISNVQQKVIKFDNKSIIDMSQKTTVQSEEKSIFHNQRLISHTKHQNNLKPSHGNNTLIKNQKISIRQNSQNFETFHSKEHLHAQTFPIESSQSLQKIQAHEKSVHQILAELNEFHRKKSQEKQRKLHKSLNIKTKIYLKKAFVEIKLNLKSFLRLFYDFFSLKEKKRKYNKLKIFLGKILIKTKIIRLNPQKSIEKKIKNQKQAEDKIRFNIEFIEKLKLQSQKQKPFFKQFLGDSQKNLVKKEKLKRKEASQQILTTGGKNKSLRDNLRSLIDTKTQKGEKQLQQLNILVQSPMKLPPIETKKCIKRKPYSVYSIYQKNSEIFTNTPGRFNWQ